MASLAIWTAATTAAGVETAQRHYELQHTSWQFLTAETGGAAVALVTVIVAGSAPDHCRWCESNAFDDAIRDALRAGNPRTAGYVSHVFAFGATSLVAAGGLMIPAIGDRELGRAGKDIWIIANTTIFTTAFTEVFKRTVGRQRPAFHYGVQAETEGAAYPEEANRSFFSLDTSAAFSIAASSTTLAFLHGYEIAPWVLGAGATMATTAGVLRIAADMHWGSDVIVGALAGTGIGVTIPLLLHERETTPKAVSFDFFVLPRGVGVVGTF